MKFNKKAFIVVASALLFSAAVIGIAVGVYYAVRNSQQNTGQQVKPITAQVENKQTANIYQRETPIIFEITPADSLMSAPFTSMGLSRLPPLKLTVVSGTGWIFDRVSPKDSSGPLSDYYFLATNHHVINFLKSINPGNLYAPSSLRFFVRMFFLKYQFEGQNNPQYNFNSSKLQGNPSAYDFSVTNGNVVATDNALFWNGSRYVSFNSTMLGLPPSFYRVLNQPLGGAGSAQPLYRSNIVFTTQDLTWTNIIDNLNIQNNVGDADLGFVRLSFTTSATLSGIPDIITNFNQNYFLPKINPFALNPVTSNNMRNQTFYIGGFPAIPGTGGYWTGESPGAGEYIWDTVRWISPATTGAFQHVYPQYNSFTNSWNYGTSDGSDPFSYNGADYNGAFTYTVPNLNLNHGSSGSMVTNAQGQIIGIYWGGLSNTTDTLFWGTIISFTLNNIPNIFNYYLNNYYIPNFIQTGETQNSKSDYINFLSQFYQPLNLTDLKYGQTINNVPVSVSKNVSLKANIVINKLKKEDGN